MIKLEDFERVLRENNFKEETINYIFSKNLSTLLQKGNKEEIDNIIKVLYKYGISQELISNSLTVLARGKAEEIEKKFIIFNKYGIKKEAIEKCMMVLAQGKADEIEKILRCNYIGANTLENCLTVLSRAKADEVIKIFEVLRKHRISYEAVEKCLTILSKGKANEIDKILNILIDENHISKQAVEKCLSVLAQGKADEIEKIFIVLNKYEINTNKIEKCLSVLALGKADEIEERIKVLYRNNIKKESIEQCLSVLTFNKAKDIEMIIKSLNKNGIGNEEIEKSLYVLARRNPAEIEDMLDIFNKNGIRTHTIQKGLSIFSICNSKKAEEIFKILNNNNVDNETMNSMFWVELSYKVDQIKEIFEEKPNYIKEYIRFKGKYNKFLTIEEIEEICEYKKISIEDFIKVAVSKSTSEIVLETLRQKESIYVGKSIPMSKEYMREKSEDLLKWASNFSKHYVMKFGIQDFDEVKSNMMEILVSKCGDIVYNMESNKNKLIKCLYIKCEKCLTMFRILYYLENSSDFQDEKKIGYYDLKNKKNGNKEKNSKLKKLNLENWNVNEVESKLLHLLSEALEHGYDKIEAFEMVSERLNIEVDKLLKIIEKIKENNNHIMQESVQRKTNNKEDDEERK